MTKKNQVYKCNVCGNIVEVLHAADGELVCCGEPMELLKEKTADTGLEKHVPVMEAINGRTKVKVGEVPHPMEEKHYIEWVEVMIGDRVYRTFLKPGDKPEVLLELAGKGMIAREYCSVHGLWKSS